MKGLGRTLVWQVRERNGPNLSLAGSEFIERTWLNPGSEFRERSRPNEPWFGRFEVLRKEQSLPFIGKLGVLRKGLEVFVRFRPSPFSELQTCRDSEFIGNQPFSEHAEQRFGPVLSPNSEPAKPGFGTALSSISEPAEPMSSCPSQNLPARVWSLEKGRGLSPNLVLAKPGFVLVLSPNSEPAEPRFDPIL